MQKRILSTKLKLILVLGILYIFIVTIPIIVDPANRVGPFGIGIPAPMKSFHSSTNNFSIEHPFRWVAHDTRQGEHGDNDVIAGIYVPGRGFPHVVIASTSLNTSDFQQLLVWGEERAREKHSDYEQINLDKFSTSYYDGIFRDYTWSSNSKLFGHPKIHCRDYYLMKNHIGYVISSCAEQDDWVAAEEVFSQMIDSFNLGDNP